jgi:hypothetical protein
MARQQMPVTADALAEQGYASSMLDGNAGSGKAQKTLMKTIEVLKHNGFSKSQVELLLAGSNGSAKAQPVLLANSLQLTSCSLNHAQVTNILGEQSKRTSVNTLNTVTEHVRVEAEARTLINMP